MKLKDVFFNPIHEKCWGCAHVNPSKGRLGFAKCNVYFCPSAWWRVSHCPLATHLEPIVETPLDAQRRRIGQQKQRRKG